MEQDVVVVGSGGAGLVAALASAAAGARVTVLERAPVFGGTTAISGGGMWLPGNPFQEQPEDREEVLSYLAALTYGRIPRGIHEAFVDAVPGLVEFLTATTAIELEGTDTPDYQGRLPGARDGGRQVAVGLYDSSRLGDLAGLVREPPSPGGTAPIRHGEQQAGGWEIGQHGQDWVKVVAERRATGILGRGRAMVGALLEACVKADVRLVTEAHVVELTRTDGRIDGVTAVVAGVRQEFPAPRGVVLACGGFEWDPDLVRDLLGVPLEAPLSPPWNTGDGLRMAAGAGARLANLSSAWWMPSMAVPGDGYDGRDRWRIAQLDKSLPGALVVDRAGRRYANECMNYPDFGKVQTRFDPHGYTFPHVPSWVVFDAPHLARYPVLHHDPSLSGGESWLVEAPTLRELAAAIGVDADGLERQVAEFNADCDAGADTVFRRGELPWERYRGDTTTAHPNLRALAPEGPYYAYRLLVGCFGTNGGPVIDEHGRVVDFDRTPIPGLYAAGNVTASVFGTAYPGGGGTLGPALVFGYLAGRHIAEAG